MRTQIVTMFLYLFLAPTVAVACTSYTVVAGDTLSRIAGQLLGDTRAYNEIYTRNVDVIGPDAELIEIGMVLKMPCEDGPPAETILASVALEPTIPDGLELPDWAVLVEANAVAALQKQGAQVLDIRSAKAHSGGVIPGALALPYTLWRGPEENPGAPATTEQLSALIGEAGLRLDRPIVIVNAKRSAFDTGRGAYVYWVLKSLGAAQLALLKGGHAAWQEAGYITAEPATAPAYPAELFMDLTWYATRSEVEAISTGSERGTLLDSRPEAMFRKITGLGLTVPTTLPQAMSSPAQNLHVKIGTDTSETEDGLAVLMRLKDGPANWQAETVVSFCNTGELGALNWFYASELAGISDVKLYPESTVGWVASGAELAAPEDG